MSVWKKRVRSAVVLKGGIDCSSNPNYPSAILGDTYIVTVAGKIGGASGIVVDVNDQIVCVVANTPGGDQATVGSDFIITQGNIEIETSASAILMNGVQSAGSSTKVPRADHVHPVDTSREPANANIQSHISSTSNPHGVTANQAGAEPANANIQSHISSTSNPHGVTAGQAGADPAGSASQAETNAKNASILRTTNVQSVDETGIADGYVVIFDKTNKTMKSGGAISSLSIPLTAWYYCDANRTDSYTEDGSRQRPFKTLTACRNALVTAKISNAYIVLLAGTYSGDVNFTPVYDSGGSEDYTIIENTILVGISRENCIISGKVSCTAQSGAGGTHGNIHIENMTITKSGLPLELVPENTSTTIKNCNVYNTGSGNAFALSPQYSQSITIDRCDIRAVNGVGIAFGATLGETHALLLRDSIVQGTTADMTITNGDVSTVNMTFVRSVFVNNKVTGIFYSSGYAQSHINQTLSTDGAYDARGGQRVVTVDENTVGVGGVLVLSSDGHYDDADNTAEATIKQLLVMAVESGTGTKRVIDVGGAVYKSNWGFSPDVTKPVYIGANGAITQTVPSYPTASFARLAGVFEGASGTAGTFRFEPSPNTVAL